MLPGDVVVSGTAQARIDKMSIKQIITRGLLGLAIIEDYFDCHCIGFIHQDFVIIAQMLLAVCSWRSQKHCGAIEQVIYN